MNIHDLASLLTFVADKVGDWPNGALTPPPTPPPRPHQQQEQLADNVKPPNGKDKNKKRPRDRVLRDKEAARTALEIRKQGAFLGYTYRRPNFSILGPGKDDHDEDDDYHPVRYAAAANFAAAPAASAASSSSACLVGGGKGMARAGVGAKRSLIPSFDQF